MILARESSATVLLGIKQYKPNMHLYSSSYMIYKTKTLYIIEYTFIPFSTLYKSLSIYILSYFWSQILI